MRTKILILILSVLLVLLIAGCSVIGLTWPREPNIPVEPTLIPLQAPLRRVLLPVHPLAGIKPEEAVLANFQPDLPFRSGQYA